MICYWHYSKKKNSKGLHKRKSGYYNKTKQDVFLCFADTINSDKEEWLNAKPV